MEHKKIINFSETLIFKFQRPARPNGLKFDVLLRSINFEGFLKLNSSENDMEILEFWFYLQTKIRRKSKNVVMNILTG